MTGDFITDLFSRLRTQLRSWRSALAGAAEVARHHRRVMYRESGTLGARVKWFLLLALVPLAVAAVPLSGQIPPSILQLQLPSLFPPVASVAIVGALACFLGWLSLPRSDPAVVAPEGPPAEHFYLTTGWSPLEKYAGWCWAGFEPLARLWALVGAEVLLYHLVAELAPELGIPVLLDPSPADAFQLIPGIASVTGTLHLLLAWLVLLVYLAVFHLISNGFRVYLESAQVRSFLVFLLATYVVVTGVAYGASSTVNERLDVLSAEALSSGSLTLPFSLVPEVLIIIGLPLLLLWQTRAGGMRRWVSRLAIWGVPGWFLVTIAIVTYLQFSGGMEELEGFGLFILLEPGLLIFLAVAMASPMEAFGTFLVENGPMLLHGINPAMTGDLDQAARLEPGYYLNLELLFFALALLWLAALFHHGFLGFHNSTYGEDALDPPVEGGGDS